VVPFGPEEMLTMLPDLSSPYDSALREAIATVTERFDPVAIVVSGTIVRGTPLPASDFDIVVVHDQPWRQRVQCFFHGVPAELFVNPAYQIRHAFDYEARNARPVLAHMLATGTIVLDRTGIAGDLMVEATANLAQGPLVSPGWLALRRYGIATAFEDAVDLEQIDPERSRTLALLALTDAIDWWFPAHGHWRPRAKSLLADFQHHCPDLSVAARQAIRSSDLDQCLAETATVLTGTIDATGFFPWESTPEPVSP
jgi:hypothetical protein